MGFRNQGWERITRNRQKERVPFWSPEVGFTLIVHFKWVNYMACE